MVMLGVAKVGGYLAQRVGQPAVLGELIGGVLVGKSVLGLVDPEYRDDSSAVRAGRGDPAVRDRAGDRPGPALEGGRDVAGGGGRGGGLALCPGFRRLPAAGAERSSCRSWRRRP